MRLAIRGVWRHWWIGGAHPTPSDRFPDCSRSLESRKTLAYRLGAKSASPCWTSEPPWPRRTSTC